MSSCLENRRAVEGRPSDRRRESITEKISGSRSIKTGSGSSEVRLERAAKRESGPPVWIVDKVVSKSLPPTLSLIRSSVRCPVLVCRCPFSISGREMEDRLKRELLDRSN